MIALIISLLGTITFYGQDTEAPYFIVKDSTVSGMPLLSSNADVHISGIIADVVLTQTYMNTSDKILEAIYVFPGSTESAVYDMEMQIGSRIVKAELKEKEEARRTYEAAKREGKRASLLEQHRPNVFQMNVANILPGEKIQVRLKYTEKILPLHGNYKFVLPTVVGPRFHDAKTQGRATFVHMPYTEEKKLPAYTCDINVYLQAGKEIGSISSHTHKVHIAKLSNQVAHITLDPSELYNGNKDFVLNYRLASKSISSGLLLYEHEDENFFLANIQPPNMLTDAEVPAKEYIFVMDISGSMTGFPLDVSKKLMKDLLKGMRPTDRFNLMLFAGTSYMYSDTSVYAIPENIEKVVNNIEDQSGGGSTYLLPALKRAIDLPRMDDNLSRSVIIITDGYISVEKEVFQTIKKNLHKANVFSFGIGSSTNRHLIEGMASVGQGVPFVVEDEVAACDVADRFIHYISKPSLTDVKVTFDGFDAYDLTTESYPDLMSERPLNILGKWKNNPNGKIIIEGKLGRQNYKHTIDIKDFRPDEKNSALRQLWARDRIQEIDDYRKIMYADVKAEILPLSLKYNLLSAYTSFVAVDYEVVNDGTKETITKKQALPMPEGVSNQAIGAEADIKVETTHKSKSKKYLKVGTPYGIDDEEVLKKIQYLFTKKIYAFKKLMAKYGITEMDITLLFNEEGAFESVYLDSDLPESLRNEIKAEITKMYDVNYITADPHSEVGVPISLK